MDNNAIEIIEESNKITEIYNMLPSYCYEYYEDCTLKNMAEVSILNYGYELKKFFEYILSKDMSIPNIKNIPLSYIENLRKTDIEAYLEYLKSERGVTGAGRARSLSVLRSFLQYCYAMDYILGNPATLVETPNIKPANVQIYQKDDLDQLITDTFNATHLNPWQKAYAQNTTLRDTSIIALLSTTNIRISQLHQLDIDDIDWENHCIYTHNHIDSYMLEDIDLKYIREYIEIERQPYDDEERALFVGSRGARGRLTTRSIERLVKKYSTAFGNNGLTPNILRRSG